jgi:hypothetical protein
VVAAPARGSAAACFGSVKRGVGNGVRQAVLVERHWSDQGGWRKMTPWSSAWKNDDAHTDSGFGATAMRGRRWQNDGSTRLLRLSIQDDGCAWWFRVEVENGDPTRRVEEEEGGLAAGARRGVRTGKNRGGGEAADRWGPVTVLVV